MAEQREPWGGVESREGFAAYLKHLVADFQSPEPQNPERDLKAKEAASKWPAGGNLRGCSPPSAVGSEHASAAYCLDRG